MLELSRISKRYPGVLALDAVDLDVAAGEVHAIVGGNGAGKSTLIKVASGVVAPDAGTVRIGGKSMARSSPVTALRLGVSVLHQERHIAFDLTVAENVLLGRMPTRAGRVRWGQAARDASAALDLVGLELDPRAPARGLSTQQLQEIELARALSAGSKVVIMDEPSAALGAQSLARLYSSVRRLREHGIAVVYISHHLDEVFEIADRITVLCDGRRVDTVATAGQTHDGLIALMFGAAAHRGPPAARRSTARQRVALRAIGLRRGTALQGVDLAVREGEILCITGAVGSGRRELARCLAGVEPLDAGRIECDGRSASRQSPRRALAAGRALVPEDRKHDGLLMELAITDNVAVSREAMRAGIVVRPRRRERAAQGLCSRLNVKAPSVHTGVRTLSGGNQQKVLLARCLHADVQLLILDEPTAGIDVRSRMEIYELLQALAAAGRAMVVFSSDYAEVGLLADRALVLRNGAVAAELGRDEISDERLMALESGLPPSADD